MGRKKSKIAKKIQATKSFGGVSVKKGSGLKHKDPLAGIGATPAGNKTMQSVKIYGNKNNNNNNKKKEKKSPLNSSPRERATTTIASSTLQTATTTSMPTTASKTTTTTTSQQFNQKRWCSGKPTSSSKSLQHSKSMQKQTTNHQDDFQSQMKSLQERMAYREQQSASSHKKAHFDFGSSLAPPSFAVNDADKSTDRLLQETTHCMESKWSSLGNNQTPLTSPQAHPSQFNLQALPHTTTTSTFSTSLQQHLFQNQQEQVQHNAWPTPTTQTTCRGSDNNHLNDNNPYAALQLLNDEEEDTGRAAPAILSFAPPSFQIPTVKTSIPQHCHDWDPDL